MREDMGGKRKIYVDKELEDLATKYPLIPEDYWNASDPRLIPYFFPSFNPVAWIKSIQKFFFYRQLKVATDTARALGCQLVPSECLRNKSTLEKRIRVEIHSFCVLTHDEVEKMSEKQKDRFRSILKNRIVK